ncbi:putative zinc-binding metallopeptidase [Caballeronia sp. RCC_10]|uniref:putative zinc-binding metallopeptidase n=1 Tax=Caballeronia sp. RCC_10 TaxID=3239227 RepID=UPI0035242399
MTSSAPCSDCPAMLERYYKDCLHPTGPTYASSAYTSLHPWEDLADTRAAYLVSGTHTTIQRSHALGRKRAPAETHR